MALSPGRPYRSLLILVVLVAVIARLTRAQHKPQEEEEPGYAALFASPIDRVDIGLAACELRKLKIPCRLSSNGLDLEVRVDQRPAALAGMREAGLPIGTPESYGDSVGHSKRLTEKMQRAFDQIFPEHILVKVRAQVETLSSSDPDPADAEVRHFSTTREKEALPRNNLDEVEDGGRYKPRTERLRGYYRSDRLIRLHVWLLTNNLTDKEIRACEAVVKPALGFDEKRGDELTLCNDPWLERPTSP